MLGTLNMPAANQLVLIAMLTGISLGASAQIFECVDAGGKIEFAQKCSPGTVRQREVAKSGAGAGAAPPQTSYKEQEQAFRRRQLEREAEEKKERTAAEASEKKCVAARSRLVSIENARRMRANDAQTGQPRYLDDNERAVATQNARDSVAANCK
jgi:hypothetical protein